MKKIIIVLISILVLVLVYLSFCILTKNVPIEQSKTNFDCYRNNIEKIVKKYGYMLYEEIDENTSENSMHIYVKNYTVKINEIATIQINMSNTENHEEFSVSYNNKINEIQDNGKNYNVKMLVEIANCISKRTFNEERCRQFLQAGEEQYPSAKYNRDKLPGQLIKKFATLNFFEDWTMYYVLTDSLEENFTLWGLAK